MGFGSSAIGAGVDVAEVAEDFVGTPRVAGAYDVGAYANSLAGWWKLNETSGVVAADSGPAGNDGQYTGSVQLGGDGVRRTAATFNATDFDDYVTLPDGMLDGASTVAVSWWMRTEKTGESAILSGANTSQANELLLFFRSDTQFSPFINGSRPTVTIDSVSDGRWRHFVYQHDRSCRGPDASGC